MQPEFKKVSVYDYFNLLGVNREECQPELGTFVVFGGAMLTVYKDDDGKVRNFMDLNGYRYTNVRYLGDAD